MVVAFLVKNIVILDYSGGNYYLNVKESAVCLTKIGAPYRTDVWIVFTAVNGFRFQCLPISTVVFQAKPMFKFQTDYDEATGEQVLTCCLLPQMEFQAENVGKCGDFCFRKLHLSWVLLFSVKQDSFHLGRMARSKFVDNFDLALNIGSCVDDQDEENANVGAGLLQYNGYGIY